VPADNQHPSPWIICGVVLIMNDGMILIRGPLQPVHVNRRVLFLEQRTNDEVSGRRGRGNKSYRDHCGDGHQQWPGAIRDPGAIIPLNAQGNHHAKE
jgi:hypothetical protein